MRILNITSPSFCAMKPNQFSGIDYACVRKFKAPVEKFDQKEDLYSWAVNQLNACVAEKNVEGKSELTKVRRTESIFEWRLAIGFDLNKAPLALIALSSLLKDVKSDNDRLPPVLSVNALSATLADLEKKLAENKELKFNFKDIYYSHLKNSLNGEDYTNFTGWVYIPSKRNDVLNFEKNVDKLKILSHDTWCTKNYHANIILEEGDFYIYLEKGNPKLGLRLKDKLLTEIQGENNNESVDVKYFDILHSFICEKYLAMEGKAFETYHSTKRKC